MIRVKPGVNIVELLKNAGYSSYRIANEKLFGQATLTKFRRNGLPSWNELDKLCDLLNCQPWDLIEYVKEEKP